MSKTPNNYRSARVSRPERSQVEMQFYALDELLPVDHQARLVWTYVTSLDLSGFYESIEVSSTQAGRTAIAPEILLALWLLATIEGIGSARELDRRAERDIAYRWICGGVSVNYHTLSDFRSKNAAALEQILVDSIAALVNQDLISLETIAQDGMRVRANAGKSSFRRKPTLESLRQQAQDHLETLKQENASEGSRLEGQARRDAARKRVAEDRLARLNDALNQHNELARKREKRSKGSEADTRTSTTDPDARNMKMANGGFNPALNVQFVSDGDKRIIVGVSVSNEGTDGGQLGPMHQQVISHYGKTPAQVLVDSAYTTKEGVQQVESRNTRVVAAVARAEQLAAHGKNPYEPQKGDSAEYAAFRKRMQEEHYKKMYRQRPSIAEFPHAVCRNRKLQQFLIRGIKKAKAVALLHALAFNFTRMLHLNWIGRTS